MQKPLKAFPLFKSIDQALTKVYEVRAASGVKTATYGIQTASSSVTDKVTTMDRVAEAAWVMSVVEAALSEVERAVVTCKYDGLGTDRENALDVLTLNNADIARNPDLVRELFIREIDFGETYSKSLPLIAQATDTSLRTVERAAQRTRSRIVDIRRRVDRSLSEAFASRGWIAARQAA